MGSCCVTCLSACYYETKGWWLLCRVSDQETESLYFPDFREIYKKITDSYLDNLSCPFGKQVIPQRGRKKNCMKHLTKAENPHDKEMENKTEHLSHCTAGGADIVFLFFIFSTFCAHRNHPMTLNAVLFHWMLHSSHIHALTTQAYILNH